MPNKVRTKARSHYELVWIDGFINDKIKTYGETRFEPKQIVINNNQGDKETIHTVWHEFLHALDADYQVGLTESQVVSLEKSFYYVREFILQLEGRNRKRK